MFGYLGIVYRVNEFHIDSLLSNDSQYSFIAYCDTDWVLQTSQLKFQVKCVLETFYLSMCIQVLETQSNVRNVRIKMWNVLQ